MPINPSSSANLPCGQCEYLNEPERVYCHNCGAKLDRSLLPKADEKKVEPPEQARKRIARMTNPKSGSFGREAMTLLKVLLYAALLAAFVLIAQKPSDVPDAKKEATLRLVSSDMMEALESPAPRALVFTEDEVNQYLKQMLRTKDSAWPGFEFKRAFTNLDPGVIRISTEQALLGFPLFAGVLYQPEVIDGKFQATVVGGNIGQLRVDPHLMKYAAAAFAKLGKNLERERKQMDKMRSVKVADGQIEIVTKGAAAVP